MDEGSEEYQILDHVWEVISKETAASAHTIPASFGHKTPNIHTKAYLFMAEDWSFWLVHLVPLLLKGHFRCPKYYKHFLKFNMILKHMLQYSFTQEELCNLKDDIISYIQEYESKFKWILIYILVFTEYRIYYQFKSVCLSACPLTLHALLHIPNNIRNNGPPCMNWTFVMEHWCGSLLPVIKSRKKPFTSLALQQYQTAQYLEVINQQQSAIAT